MPWWIGETWECKVCGWLNAVIRIRCRHCGRSRNIDLYELQAEKEKYESTR